jgi:hypothetical protein
VIWKAKANEAERGIIALAEILSDPATGVEPSRAYWADPTRMDEAMSRVKIRYVVPSGFPLWEGGSATSIIEDLSVGHATGGTVFKVTVEQWDRVMDFIGGWPDDTTQPEVEAALDIVAQVVGDRPSGQGFLVDPVERRALERYAMQMATRHYQARGWQVEDVSSHCPFDLQCTRADRQVLHVEVKGTTSNGSAILLTRNEVEHARATYPHVALYIVADLQVGAESSAISGGRVIVCEPWQPHEEYLRPLAYTYSMLE